MIPRHMKTQTSSDPNDSCAMASSILTLETQYRSSLGSVEGMSLHGLPSHAHEAHTISRICPGRYFALDTLFVNVACVLHVFDIQPPIGDDGLPIKVEHVQSDTFVSCVS